MKYSEKKREPKPSRQRLRNILCIAAVLAVFLILSLVFLFSDGMLNSFWLPRFAAKAGLRDFSSERASFSFFFTPSFTVKKVRFKTSSGYSITADSVEADWKNREFFFSRQRKLRKMRVNGFAFEKISDSEKKDSPADRTASSSGSVMTAEDFFLTVKDGESLLPGTGKRLSWKKVRVSSENLSLMPLSGKFLFSGSACGQSEKEIIAETPDFSGSTRFSLKNGAAELTEFQIESGTMVFFPTGKVSPSGSGELSGEIHGKNVQFQGKFRENGGSLLYWEIKKAETLSCDFELLLADSDLASRAGGLCPFLNLSGFQGRTEGSIRMENEQFLFRSKGNMSSGSFCGRKNAALEFRLAGAFSPADSLLKMEESCLDFSLEGKNLLALRMKRGIFSPRETEFPEGTAEFQAFPLDMFLPFPGLCSSGKIKCSRTAGEKNLILQLEINEKKQELASVDGELKVQPGSWSGIFSINLPEGTALWETSGSVRHDGSFNGWAGIQRHTQSFSFLVEGGKEQVKVSAGPVSMDILNGHFLQDSCSFAETVFQMHHLHDSKDGNLTEKGQLKLSGIYLVSAGKKYDFEAAYEYDWTSGSGKAVLAGIAGEKKTLFADLSLSLRKERKPAMLLQSALLDLKEAETVLSLFRAPSDPEKNTLSVEPAPFSPEERENSSAMTLDMNGIRCPDGSTLSCKGELRFKSGKTDCSGLDFSGSRSGKEEFLKLFNRHQVP